MTRPKETKGNDMSMKFKKGDLVEAQIDNPNRRRGEVRTFKIKYGTVMRVRPNMSPCCGVDVRTSDGAVHTHILEWHAELRGSARALQVRKTYADCLDLFAKYLHFQDFADGVVGPFSSQAEIDLHLAFLKKRGDGAVLLGTFDEGDAKLEQLRKDDVLFMTPEEDRAMEVA